MEIKMKGKIKWFHQIKGYGFITTEEGEDVDEKDVSIRA